MTPLQFVLHEIASPLTAVVAGLDLLDGQNDPELAFMIKDSTKRLQNCFRYMQGAFSFSINNLDDIKALAEHYFTTLETHVMWDIPDGLEAHEGSRFLMALLLIAQKSWSAQAINVSFAQGNFTINATENQKTSQETTKFQHLFRHIQKEAEKHFVKLEQPDKTKPIYLLGCSISSLQKNTFIRSIQ